MNKLQLSADTIASIFQGDIKTWDDAAIKADNPGVDLPSTTITVAHRSDGSGTTAGFTLYLTKAAASTWKLGTDKTVAWPANEQAGNGNSGVAQIIHGTNGAIGYVDYSDAKASGLSSQRSRTSPGSTSRRRSRARPRRWKARRSTRTSRSILSTRAGEGVPDHVADVHPRVHDQTDSAVGNALKGFLNYIYGPGQGMAASRGLRQAPVQHPGQAKAQLDKITVS